MVRSLLFNNFLVFCSARDGTQGLVHARQVSALSLSLTIFIDHFLCTHHCAKHWRSQWRTRLTRSSLCPVEFAVYETMLILRPHCCQAPVAHAHNPSYLGCWNQEDHGSSPVLVNNLEDPFSKITRAKGTGGVTQAVECLLCNCKALILNQRPTKKKKKKKKKIDP
jgi:hypothetical protein